MTVAGLTVERTLRTLRNQRKVVVKCPSSSSPRSTSKALSSLSARREGEISGLKGFDALSSHAAATPVSGSLHLPGTGWQPTKRIRPRRFACRWSPWLFLLRCRGAETAKVPTGGAGKAAIAPQGAIACRMAYRPVLSLDCRVVSAFASPFRIAGRGHAPKELQSLSPIVCRD